MYYSRLFDYVPSPRVPSLCAKLSVISGGVCRNLALHFEGGFSTTFFPVERETSFIFKKAFMGNKKRYIFYLNNYLHCIVIFFTYYLSNLLLLAAIDHVAYSAKSRNRELTMT